MKSHLRTIKFFTFLGSLFAAMMFGASLILYFSSNIQNNSVSALKPLDEVTTLKGVSELPLSEGQQKLALAIIKSEHIGYESIHKVAETQSFWFKYIMLGQSVVWGAVWAVFFVLKLRITKLNDSN